MRIKLYIEGGGDSRLQDTQFREGWRRFFEKAGLQGRMPRAFRGGGRDQTFDAFKTAVRTRKQNEFPLLLVDSEDLVEEGRTEWEHLKVRDGWDKPNGAGDEDACLMVCCMETWFLADAEAMRSFFQAGWRENAIPQWPDLEKVPKAMIFQVLAQATASCEDKAYAKGKVSFDLLKVINPSIVEEKCPCAKRLLDRLRTI